MVSTDPYVLALTILCLVAFILGTILRHFKQPSVIAYILTGILLGPFVFGLITDTEMVTNIGNLGVVFLLFFIGLSISPNELVTRWKIAILGTLFQIVLSVIVVFAIGSALGWSLGRIVLFGFIISLSSTAVVVKILEARKELYTNIGQDVLSILIVQDLAVIPMIVVLSMLSGHGIESQTLILQLAGCALALLLVLWIMRQKEIKLPYSEKLKEDPDMQLFAALVFTLGMATLSGFLGLSTALGAFIAGMFIASTKEVRWVQQTLEPFKVFFIALFFISIGLLIDLKFLFSEFLWIALFLFLILLTNSILNAIIFRFNGESWRTSFYAGSILAQIGEFSFVLVAIGLQNGLVSEFSYQLTIQVIAISLMLTPVWIYLFSRLVDESEVFIRNSARMAFQKPSYRYHHREISDKKGGEK